MSNKTIYLYNSGDGTVSSHELKVTKDELDDRRIKLKFDKNDQQWTELVRGKTAGTLKDHGNGITIKLRDKKKPIELDYSQMVDVQLLLKYYLEDSGLTSFKQTIRKLKEVE